MIKAKDALVWTDRVYGKVAIDDAGALGIIGCPTFQRLKGILQAGPSALAFPFKTVTRYEHSLGVYLLLRRLGADRQEQMAGLLHDVSHTAFSHAVDFLFDTEEQAHHEGLKSLFLEREDLRQSIEAAGFTIDDFDDDTRYPLLERPLPWLCADRLDYFLRDGRACGVVSVDDVLVYLTHLDVVDRTIVFTDEDVARRAAEQFARMNRDWWASPTEAYIYNEFALALRRAFDRGVIQEDDLLLDDETVLSKLRASGDSELIEPLRQIETFDRGVLDGYVPKVIPKVRWLDPPVRVNGSYVPVSEMKHPATH